MMQRRYSHYSSLATERGPVETIRQRDQRPSRSTTEALIYVSLAAYQSIWVFQTVREDLVIDRRNEGMLLIAGAIYKPSADEGTDGEREAGGVESWGFKGRHCGRILFRYFFGDLRSGVRARGRLYSLAGKE